MIGIVRDKKHPRDEIPALPALEDFGCVVFENHP